MKNQALFSSKDKGKNLKCRLLEFLFGTLRVNQACIQFPTQANKLKLSCIKQAPAQASIL